MLFTKMPKIMYLRRSVTSWWIGRPPQPIQKLRMLLEQLCIIDLTPSKCRLNKGHCKTLHKSGICLIQ